MIEKDGKEKNASYAQPGKQVKRNARVRKHKWTLALLPGN